MYKLITVIVLALGSFNALSFEHLPMGNTFQTQDIVKMKLWYEGIAVESNVAVSEQSQLAEELLVPLTKFKF
jgi:hypothetical protein